MLSFVCCLPQRSAFLKGNLIVIAFSSKDLPLPSTFFISNRVLHKVKFRYNIFLYVSTYSNFTVKLISILAQNVLLCSDYTALFLA